MRISEETLFNLEEILKKNFLGTRKIQQNADFYSDSFNDYLEKTEAEELRLCRISSTREDIYFFFCWDCEEKPEEVLSIEFYFNKNGIITDIAVYGLL